MITILLILFTHYLTDWILQPRAVARRKASSWRWMSVHVGIILCGSLALAGVLTPTWSGVICALFYTVAHGMQDKLIWLGYERLRGPYTKEFLEHNLYAEDYWWYFFIAVDQLLHLALLFWLFV